MAHATGPERDRAGRVKMTIRVYSVNRRGQVIEDRGTLSIMDGHEPLPATAAFRPCKCFRHKG